MKNSAIQVVCIAAVGLAVLGVCLVFPGISLPFP
jgi:hypothetical protein